MRVLGLLGGIACIAACGGPELELGTYAPGERPPLPRSARSARGLARVAGEIGILEGDDESVSDLGGPYGLVISPDRNDLAQVSARFAEEIVDREAVLLLFTTFDDRGAAGPAYYVPFARTTEGLGLPPLDQRAAFGVTHLVGVANLKNPDHHPTGRLLPRLLHELAHPELAYLNAEVLTGTVAVPLLGRQNAHWHAALQSEGSVLGGHDFVETAPGRWLVLGRDRGYSRLDRYGLGLLGPEGVAPFFFLQGARNLNGFPIPAAAELPPGTELYGQKVEVTIEDVIRAVGPRRPAFPEAPTRREVVVGLLTAPGESGTSTRALATVEQIEGLLGTLEARYAQETGGVGSLCWRLTGCDPAPPDPPPPTEEPGGCSCQGTSAPSPVWPWALLGLLLRGRRFGRSSARSDRPA